MSAQFAANQNQIRRVKRYFVGTTALREGQILHYQENASASNADPKLRLGSAVEAANSDNVKFFAGIVPLDQAGLTGPCYVELEVPVSGDVVTVEADGTTDIAVGDALEPDGTKSALVKGTAAAGEALFIALAAHAADSVGKIKVYKS